MNFKGVDICCPHCRGDLALVDGDLAADGRLRCAACSRTYPVLLGIPDLRIFPDPYIDVAPDHAKGRQIAAAAADRGFPELIDYYYGITDVVPPRHAALYKRGLLAAEARAAAALAAWEAHAAAPPGAALLDLGCGTAPLLVAAAGQYRQLVGVDIAFRWLVMAQKRLAAAGLPDVPLICACAEALPFPDGRFDRVAAESVVETVADQPRAVREVARVLRADGRFFLATPNKYSLGPDPHAGLPAGGWLPDRWIAAYVRRQGGIPPRRRLLSARALARLLQTAGFAPPRVFLPDITAAQRAQVGGALGLAVDAYQAAKRLPLSRDLLRLVGPLLYATARKAAT